ncbi:MAG: hypothetical protein S4CHLAM102_01260 [Chlamydiia bacterium]|nr:hypothetical protein [Chlamydiia bacterium]
MDVRQKLFLQTSILLLKMKAAKKEERIGELKEEEALLKHKMSALKQSGSKGNEIKMTVDQLADLSRELKEAQKEMQEALAESEELEAQGGADLIVSIDEDDLDAVCE